MKSEKVSPKAGIVLPLCFSHPARNTQCLQAPTASSGTSKNPQSINMSLFGWLAYNKGEQERGFWPLVLFGVHFAHAFLAAHLYPYHIHDTDLYAYFIYFRNWLEQILVLHPTQFFPVPKPLLCFTFGLLGNAQWAFYCSALASAFLGSLSYLIGRHFFNHATGLFLSIFLLLDPLKGILTVESSADLYLTVFLFSAIYLFSTNRFLPSSCCLLLSALVKPVTLPCALYYLNAGKKGWAYITLPLLAIPLTLLANQLLLGNMTGSSRFFAEFTALRDLSPIASSQLLHFIFWIQIVKTRFILTASWGFLGFLLWTSNDKRHLRSPFLSMMFLFLLGYLTFSVFSPYTPLFRFYWPLEIWFLAFLIYGIVESTQRIFSSAKWARVGARGLLLFFLLDDSLRYYFTYRNDFAIPFEKGMAFVASSVQVIGRERNAEETVLISLAFVPYVMWELEVRARPLVIAAEVAAKEKQAFKPDWIVYVPEISANQRVKDFVGLLTGGGEYEPRLSNGTSVLFHRKTN